jgi:uncharacterized protein YaaW (UPF0174 family)
MHRLSESERKELLHLTRENNAILKANNRILKNILTIISNEYSSDFMNNIVANIISNGITSVRNKHVG